jgi:hypothetical protein
MTSMIMMLLFFIGICIIGPNMCNFAAPSVLRSVLSELNLFLAFGVGLAEVDDFYFVVLDVAFLEVAFYPADYFGDDFVGVAGVGAYAGYTDGGRLPLVVVGYFGGGDVELVGEAREERFDVVALVFEGIVFGEVECDACCANNHGECGGAINAKAECLAVYAEGGSATAFTFRISVRHRADSNR